MTVQAFVDAVSSADCPPDQNLYISNPLISDLFPECLEDLQPRPEVLGPDWVDDGFLLPARFGTPRGINRYELLFGQAGSFSPILHFDTLGLHAFILQIYGRKTVYLAPASETPNLYQNPRTPNQSLVPINGDLTKYPLVEGVKAYRADLDPGDLLFIPAGWWHGAFNPVVSIAVTINSVNNSNWTRFSEEWILKRKLAGSRRTLAQLIFTTCGAWRRVRSKGSGGRSDPGTSSRRRSGGTIPTSRSRRSPS
jgi:hypothetical protein